ncbi:MAG: hypothetical protein EOO03_02065 [Chitinophagaceae bacterium]|nr:MAG: hypothetical protein EOO03_02065 [Chitinophagaceae bacterium]
MPEAGGDAAAYIAPYDSEALAKHMMAIATDKHLAATMIAKGKAHAANFNNSETAAAVMKVYQKLLP